MAAKRKQIPKARRLQIYSKYDGHCAYCGCAIEYKEMQVDHIEPIYPYETAYTTGNAEWLDDLDNLLPACRACNFYKSTVSVEKFRQQVQTIPERLERIFIFRLALKYGIVKLNRDPVKFLFEKERGRSV